jgi:hypothetical protein
MKEPIGRSEISKYLALPDLEWCMRKSLTEKSIIILSLLLSKEGTLPESSAYFNIIQ